MWDLQLSEGIALVVGLYLLPGMIAILVRNRLGGVEGLGKLEFALHAVAFDLPIIGLLVSMRGWGLTPFPFDSTFNWVTALAAGLLAIAFGLITGVWAARGTWQRILFRLGWSKRSKSNAWIDAFQLAEAAGSWACVHLEDGRVILGSPKFYSSSSSETAVFLSRGPVNGEPVLIADKDGLNPLPQPGPGVLITPAARIALVAFLDPAE